MSEIPTATTNWSLVRALNMHHTEACPSSSKPKKTLSTDVKRNRPPCPRPNSCANNKKGSFAAKVKPTGALVSRGISERPASTKSALLQNQNQQGQTLKLFPEASVHAPNFGSRMGVIPSYDKREQSAHKIPCDSVGGSGGNTINCQRQAGFRKKNNSALVGGSFGHASKCSGSPSFDRDSWEVSAAVRQNAVAQYHARNSDHSLAAMATLPINAVVAAGIVQLDDIPVKSGNHAEYPQIEESCTHAEGREPPGSAIHSIVAPTIQEDCGLDCPGGAEVHQTAQGQVDSRMQHVHSLDGQARSPIIPARKIAKAPGTWILEVRTTTS